MRSYISRGAPFLRSKKFLLAVVLVGMRAVVGVLPSDSLVLALSQNLLEFAILLLAFVYLASLENTIGRAARRSDVKSQGEVIARIASSIGRQRRAIDALVSSREAHGPAPAGGMQSAAAQRGPGGRAAASPLPGLGAWSGLTRYQSPARVGLVGTSSSVARETESGIDWIDVRPETALQDAVSLDYLVIDAAHSGLSVWRNLESSSGASNLRTLRLASEQVRQGGGVVVLLRGSPTPDVGSAQLRSMVDVEVPSWENHEELVLDSSILGLLRNIGARVQEQEGWSR